MYMKTKSTKQTVHNGFGQFPKIVQLKHDYFCNSGHVTPGITYSFTFSLSLANDCPNIFLSLLKDNATSRNPALPSGQKQCNVLHSSPASGFLFSFSFLLYFSRQKSVYFATSLHKLKSQQLTTQLHTAKIYVSKPMQHMQPSFPIQVISEPMQHMQPSPVRDVHSP